MASNWRLAKRSKYRYRVSQDPEDLYRLDPKKSNAENAYDIYKALCCRETRDTKRLFLLNGLATLCQMQQKQQDQMQQKYQQQQQKHPLQYPQSQKHQSQNQHQSQHQHHHQHQEKQLIPAAKKYNLGFTTEELLYCLSANLVHTFTQVRAAALRTTRYTLNNSKDIKTFNSMQLPHLVCRSIDIMLKNDDERVQALKLIRKMLTIAPEDISSVLVRCLVSLADNGIEDNDNMLRACLATLCEFAVLNPTLLIVCGGVTSITRNVLECHSPRMAESLCGVLLYLLEWPQTRNICGVRLDCLAAPYCDFTYRLGIMDKNKDARELRYTSCRLALLSILRSWTGTLEFCDPSKISGLKSIVDALYLNQIEVRKAILDLLYELLGVPQPPWTDDYNVVLQALDPADFQDTWLLSNGFVAMEGRSILPSLASRAPNVCYQHLALQLYCFLETGLPNALVEVIATSEASLAVRTTVILGKILHLIHTHLPADIACTSTALPSLVDHATQGNLQAGEAILALQSYQKMLRNRPASNSLFLDSIIQSGGLIHTRLFCRDITGQEQLPTGSNLLTPNPIAGYFMTGGAVGVGGTINRIRLGSVSSSDESMSQSSTSRRSSFRFKQKFLPFWENLRINRLIKDSNVLTIQDPFKWDWDIVTTILRSNSIKKLDDTSMKFFKRLVEFYKPGSNRFSHQDLVQSSGMPSYVNAGLDLIDCLLTDNDDLDRKRLLTDYFSDVSMQLLAITTSNRAHDCLFSPQHMSNTMCQLYFLYIGRMCRKQSGIEILSNTAVFTHLTTLVRNTDHVCYVKLIVSGLDYTVDALPKKVLEKALTSGKTRSGRLYATQFLTVLLRARIPNFEVWGLPLIIQQTKDPDRAVTLAAMEILEEACHEKYYLEEIVSIWRNFKPLGDVGRLLMARYYSLSRGLNHQRAKIKEEIEYWRNGYNKRYVLLVEADTHSSLTLHTRNEDGYYSRRNCNTRPIVVPPNIPPHLYGQMVQTQQGTTALKRYGDIPYLIEVINQSKCNDDIECLELKAAIWAISHATTHTNGIEYVTECGPRIFEKLVSLATSCEVYSIRSTCFHSLGLISCTNAGANLLFKLNWLTIRHDRNTVWPVHQQEDWLSNNYTPVRHQLEEMPPYNYSGIEDQIDGSYYTGSYWNLLSGSSTTKEGAPSASSEAPDINTTTESIKTTDESSSKQLSSAAKSKTLPEGSNPRFGKHQRSLSESKTTDVLSLLNNTTLGLSSNFQHHRIRYNSCTDSNTSGVSSCESVTGRVPVTFIGELQQFQLSPIPSMSNLMDIIPPAKISYLRRPSLIQNTISPVDIKGYAKLRSLRRHCRPVLSESAAELYDIVDRLPSKSSESQRRLKVRSLDRQASLRLPMYSEEVQFPMPTLNAPKFLSLNDTEGPCYAGICLPKNILDLFARRNLFRTYVSSDIHDHDLMDINLLTAKQQFLNDSLNNEGGDESSVISSLSDVSSVSKRSKWLGGRHGRSNCLHCSRAKRNRSTNAQRMEGDSAGTAISACEIYTNATAALVAAGLQAAVTLSRKTGSTKSSNAVGVVTAGGSAGAGAGAGAAGIALQNSSTIHLSDISFNSPESILSEESMPDRVTASILYNVQRLANPVSAKQSKMALLELKQKHANSFQDICLYSEVCKTIGRTSYRMTARRFLQELFLDLNFDTFFTEPLEILNKKEKELSKDERINDNLELKGGNGSSVHGSMAVTNVVNNKNSSSNIVNNNNDNSNNISNYSGGIINNSSNSNNLNSNNSSIPPSSGIGTTYHSKSHMKSQPLASVYESSCENLLLDQMPKQPPHINLNDRFENSKDIKIEEREKLVVTPPPPAAPPPIPYPNELHITTDDDDDDLNENYKSGFDEVDGTNFQNNSLSPTKQSNSNASTPTTVITVQKAGGSSGFVTPIESCNYSDQATNSNRSSMGTISQATLINNTGTTNSSRLTGTSRVNTDPMENENKKYTRGRFYTLELDLSCTKNKFPITDRSRGNRNINSSSTSLTKTENTILRRQNSLSDADTSSNNCKNSVKRHSAYIIRPAFMKFVANPYGVVTFASEAIQDSQSSDAEPTTSNITITKSLAASLAKPIGSLYCEKRLQSSKSEALLTNVPPLATVVGGGTPVLLTTTATTSVRPCKQL